MEDSEGIMGGGVGRMTHGEEDGVGFCTTIFCSGMDDGLVVSAEGGIVDGEGGEGTNKVEAFELLVEDGSLEWGVVEGVGEVEKVGVGM